MSKKIAVVTGAGGGIGREIVTQLNDRGFLVYATDLAIDLMDGLPEAIQKAVIDVTSADSIQATIDSIVNNEGRIDLLVNNAGFAQLGAVECVPIELAQKEFDVNVFGYGRMLQAVLPVMRSQRSGHVINMSSIVGKIAMPGFGWYSASKHAVEAISDSLREELRMFNIAVSIIEPGLIATPFIGKQVESIAGAPHPSEYESIAKAPVHAAGNGEKGADPKIIGKAVADAAIAVSPPIRHALPLDSKSLIVMRKLVGDRILGKLMRSAFKIPKRA